MNYMPDTFYRDIYRRPWGRMSYLHYGGGSPVIFLHSTGRNALDFPELFPWLTGARRCFAPDLCGHGQSDLPTKTITVSDLAHDVLELIAELYLGRCSLVGHGTGGVIALEMLRLQPEIVDRVVLLDTFLPEGRRLELFDEDLVPEFNRQKLLQFRQALARWPVSIWEDFLITARAHSERDLLYSTMRELLFVYATRRRTLLPTRLQLDLPERENVTLHWMEAATHFFPLEEPDDVGRVLRRFLIEESTDFTFSLPENNNLDESLPPASLDELLFQ